MVTVRHVYVRGHGPTGRYSGSYPDQTLGEGAQHIGIWRAEGKTVYVYVYVYVYVDNDQNSAAPKDAAWLWNSARPRARAGTLSRATSDSKAIR